MRVAIANRAQHDDHDDTNRLRFRYEELRIGP